jgi:streptogramin lyase
MSPNVATWIVGLAGIAMFVSGAAVVVANSKGRGSLAMLGATMAMACIPVLYAAFELRDFATGAAHYELRPQPDGAVVWMRVDARHP